MTTEKSGVRKNLTIGEVKKALMEVARIGQMFVEGDACREALQPWAQTFMSGDDMDFNPEVCVPLKKTLLRLERLSRVPCSTAIWRRRPDMPECVEALIFGSCSSPMSDGKPANRGYRPPRMFPEIRRAFVEGKPGWKIMREKTGVMIERGLFQPVVDTSRDTVIELFVPVRDSMGEIAAALEVFTATVGRVGGRK
ncbi:MAG: hypothetical protein N2255_04045 [Kiritimatiellae bacterium]|nr:hypothetical protein [Kiritimatiellia bacterium]